MAPLLTTVGSVIALVTSVLAAWGSWMKVNADRKRGVGEAEMARSRFGLEALQAALNVKDTIITQYQEENNRLRIEVHDLKVEVERLNKRRKGN
mgnify:FL=1